MTTPADRFAAAQPGQSCYLTSRTTGYPPHYIPATIKRRTAARLMVVADRNPDYEYTFHLRGGRIEEYGSRQPGRFTRKTNGLELDTAIGDAERDKQARQARAFSAFAKISNAGHPTQSASKEQMQEHLALLEALMAEARAAAEAL